MTDADLLREFEAILRRVEPTEFDLLAEEARWAARSGPCVVLRPARTAVAA